LLKVFTSSAHPLEANETYGRFRAYAVLNHGGDFSAAAKELKAKGYGSDQQDSKNGSPQSPPGKAPGKEAGPPPVSFELKWIPSSVFFKGDYRPQWLVKKLFVARQPMFVGGPHKNLKTSLLLDLILSLGSGTPFLGMFAVPNKLRVAILSGESGEWTLQETGMRICAAKGIKPEDTDVLWQFELPQLANQAHVAELARAIEESKVQLLIIDPMYLALLAGSEARGLQASNLMDIGPLLMNVTKACLKAGGTPVLAHHARKNLADPFSPIELADLAFSGVAEFARQWLLVNRREKYEPDSGLHKLWMGVGGSCGQSGLWAVDVNEGKLQEDFSGRVWEVSVTQGGEAREKAKEEKVQRKEKELDGAVLAVIDRLDSQKAGLQVARIRESLGWAGAKLNTVLARLIGEGILEEFDLQVEAGKGAKKSARAVKRVVENTSISLPQPPSNLFTLTATGG
jgi:hypothetical protein